MKKNLVFELLDLETSYPMIKKLKKEEQTIWKNPNYHPVPNFLELGMNEMIMLEAKERFERFRPLLQELFPQLEASNGKIESPLHPLTSMIAQLGEIYEIPIKGKVLLKRDDLLPVAGSIKARGGFHEVLSFAEKLAINHGIIGGEQDDYLLLKSDSVKELFSQYTIAVGSTGNLGLSIGLMGSALNFNVAVHMSADAKEWKKQRLRNIGVTVVEHDSDYSRAVEVARAECNKNPNSYFVDDENSKLLFAGYSVSALELKEQLDVLDIPVDSSHPLFVYLPCGVGGGPGGITFGLKLVFGEHVHCYFAEPTQSPCMLIGMMTQLHDQISVQDINLSNKTEADGLAVGRASVFVGKLMEPILSGIYTIKDQELYKLLIHLFREEGIFLEPSALAGMKGPTYTSKDLKDEFSTHIVWATGGSIVPDAIKEMYLKKSEAYL
ncbi:D-serine ammonia-lyase [Ureibacillus sp. NPDC094379]